MAVVADDLVRTVYGPGWGPVVALFRVFVAFTLVRSLTSPSSMIYNITGRPGIGFKVTAWMTPVYLAAILIGTEWGAVGVATGVVIVRGVGALLELRIAGREIDLRIDAVGRVLLGPAGLTLVMAGVVWAGRLALEAAGVGVLPRLLAATLLGGTVYVGVLAVLQPAGYDDLARSFRSVIPGLRRRMGAGRLPADPPLVTPEPS
jgi:O-antigen/teichoic acid export membrane protein